MSTSDANSKLALLGGQPHCGDIAWPTWPQHDQTERELVLQVLDSGKWWFGELVQRFEAEFAQFQGAPFAVSCTNGTTAIEMALRGLGVVPGDEVIVPPYSFIATASAVVTIGAIPVFADILPDTLCLDPDDVSRKITDKTRAIVPVHVAGMVADMPRLNQLAEQHNLVVLEDAAHAWGSQSDGRGAGTLGRAGTFSFQESKNLTAGEGGVMVTADEELADLCRSFTHCGRTKGAEWYDHNVLGSNLRITEFQAALLLAQLTRAESQLAQRQQNAELLDSMVRDLPGVQTLAVNPTMNRRSYHMYIFRWQGADSGVSRERLVEALEAEGVPASAGWYRPLYRNGVFQQAHVGPAHGIRSPLADLGVSYQDTNCPVCEQVCQDAVWIPQNALLSSTEQMSQLGQAIQKVVGQVEQLS